MKALRIVNPILLSSLLATLLAASAFAYPVVDQVVATGGEPIRVYPDHATPGQYWYIPQSIEPWKRDNRYRSALIRTPNALTFIFRGQASVEPAVIERVAASVGTSSANFTPVAFEYSKNFTCQNIYGEDPALRWVFPKMIGNYLEIVPVSLRTTSPDLIEELSYLLGPGGGLACTVEVGFKAVSTAYRFKMTADMNQIYSRFEAAAHVDVLWYEADIHTLIESLRREQVIKLESLEDTTIPQTELDKKMNAAMDEIIKHITAAMFTPAKQLPDAPIAARGKPWSFRADYRRSEQTAHYEAVLDSRRVQTKDTQISLRMANQ